MDLVEQGVHVNVISYSGCGGLRAGGARAGLRGVWGLEGCSTNLEVGGGDGEEVDWKREESGWSAGKSKGLVDREVNLGEGRERRDRARRAEKGVDNGGIVGVSSGQ